jgi:predicted alpha/beta-hydrolase family hydrolase
MQALIFGGMSPRHQAWVRDVAAALQSDFDEVRLLDYRHWGSQNGAMDMEHEIAEAIKLAEGLTDYVVVAKSIGSVLTSLAIAHGLLAPRHCLFMGFPLRVVLEEFPETAEALPHLPPTTFLHNENDPLGTSDAVKAYLTDHAPRQYVLQTVPGDTHDYVDFELIARLARV